MCLINQKVLPTWNSLSRLWISLLLKSSCFYWGYYNWKVKANNTKSRCLLPNVPFKKVQKKQYSAGNRMREWLAAWEILAHNTGILYTWWAYMQCHVRQRHTAWNRDRCSLQVANRLILSIWYVLTTSHQVVLLDWIPFNKSGYMDEKCEQWSVFFSSRCTVKSVSQLTACNSVGLL